MISRLIIIVLTLLLAYRVQLAVATPSLRHKQQNSNFGSTNTVATNYRTVDLHRYLTDTEYIPWIHDSAIPSSKCLQSLAASADNNGNIKSEDYLILTNELSNGYYTANNIDTYDTLPNINKVVYMMLVCQCVPGIDDNDSSSMSTCCPIDDNTQSYLDVSNINIENPDMMSDEYNQYLSDICSMTLRAIGSKVLLVNTETRTAAPVAAPPVMDNEEEESEVEKEEESDDVNEEVEGELASIDEIMDEVANTRFDPSVVGDSDTKDDESTSTATGESEEDITSGVDSTTASVDDDNTERKVNIGAIIGSLALLVAVIALVYFSQRGNNNKVEVEPENEVSTEDVNGDIGNDNKEDGVVQPPVSPARSTTGSYIGNVKV